LTTRNFDDNNTLVNFVYSDSDASEIQNVVAQITGHVLDHVVSVLGLEHSRRVFVGQPSIVVRAWRLFRFAAESHFVDDDAEIRRHYEIADGCEQNSTPSGFRRVSTTRGYTVRVGIAATEQE